MCEIYVKADPMLYESRSRSLRIHGGVTKIRLENHFWDILAEIAASDGYTTNHKRIRVTLSVFMDSLQHIRDDSRATVSQNGLLGDQLVQISVGRGQQIQPGGRIQTTPALLEELDNVKERLDGVFSKVEETIGGIAELVVHGAATKRATTRRRCRCSTRAASTSAPSSGR